MFSKIAALALLAGAFAQQINTPPSLTTCVPVQLAWSGGAGPYFLSVLPGGQASGTPLKQFGQVTGTSTTWVVDLAAGTSITLSLTDSTGAVVYSSPVTIQEGTSTDCVNGDTQASTTGEAVSSSTEPVSSSASSEAAPSVSSFTSAVTPSASSLGEESSSTPSGSVPLTKPSSAAPSSSSAAPTVSSHGEKVVAGFGAMAVAAMVAIVA